MPDSLQTLVDYTLAVSLDFDMSYAQTLTRTDNWASRFCTMNIQTENDTENFLFLQQCGGIRMNKEGNEPLYETVLGDHTSISLKMFDKGMEIPISKFANNTIRQMYMDRVDGMGIEMGFLPLDRLVRALNYGDTDSYYTVWDGQQLFSASHSLNGNTYANLFSGAFSATTFKAVKAAMQKIPIGDDGEYLPMTGVQWTVLAPTDLEYTIQEVLTNKQSPESYKNTENVLAGAAQYICDNRFDQVDTNDWYLVASMPGYNPFIHLQQTIPDFPVRSIITDNDPNSGSVKKGYYRWYTRTWEEVFPSNWYLVSKVVASGGTA